MADFTELVHSYVALKVPVPDGLVLAITTSSFSTNSSSGCSNNTVVLLWK